MENQFRTVVLRFPESIRNTFNLTDYDLHGYLQGERCDKLHTLTIHHFDCIELINESENANTKEKFIHALGFRENQKTILIFKKRK